MAGDVDKNKTIYFRDEKTLSDLSALADRTSLSSNLIVNIILEKHLPEYTKRPGKLLSEG